MEMGVYSSNFVALFSSFSLFFSIPSLAISIFCFISSSLWSPFFLRIPAFSTSWSVLCWEFSVSSSVPLSEWSSSANASPSKFCVFSSFIAAVSTSFCIRKAAILLSILKTPVSSKKRANRNPDAMSSKRKGQLYMISRKVFILFLFIFILVYPLKPEIQKRIIAPLKNLPNRPPEN